MEANSRPAIETVHRLLFEALVEMRAQGHDQKNKVVFHLADLFHNVVLEMENAAQGRRSYEEVLRMVEERAKEKGCERWFRQALDQLSEIRPEEKLAKHAG